MKLNLGSGPYPIHPQHFEIMKDLSEWTLVDKYVQHPTIKQWDATDLQEVEDGTVETIYASHLLEHFPHVETRKILSHWHSKLRIGGELIINVPDLVWAAKRLIKWEKGAMLDGYYHTIDGDRGVLSIFYGTESHEGEYHKSGFTASYLEKLLLDTGLRDVTVKEFEDAHEMGVLLGRGTK